MVSAHETVPLAVLMCSRGARRHGEPSDRHRGRELAALRRVWGLEAPHLALPPALAPGDRVGGGYGRRGERYTRESR